ncbi:acyl-CoA thioesterase [Robiginitalea biformata]|uniref:Uncharacterized protein n=1 Tax=Robiginitalea biformata (strain ATCC BAA-864 / DSM 15991 / KCTC 12146 / HTCC2501) TaxID=313596 RepID=A4CLR7_ROBBH|nr:acyl-CoA thioesterase [Robiginitalea biformata]EAR15816.1 hypothetical protein RB2501_15849 [Robiginitalea biformata HTCC2501]
MNRYRTYRRVAPEDLDNLDHVNNIRYLEWVQELAGDHWAQLTRPEWDADYIWVVKSHQIQYHRSALLGEELALETFVEEARGAISKRVVEIRMRDSLDPVATCKTEWCLLEKSRLTPVRMPSGMIAALLGR